MNFMSKNMKNKPPLIKPSELMIEYIKESEKELGLKWYDELLVVYLPVTLVALFVICILKIIIN